MDKVTQANAATAEETSSAATELNTQTVRLKAVIAELTAMVNGLQMQEMESMRNRSYSSDENGGGEHASASDGQVGNGKTAGAARSKSPSSRLTLPSGRSGGAGHQSAGTTVVRNGKPSKPDGFWK
jgi:methyl-accepting chemotaxis protein